MLNVVGNAWELINGSKYDGLCLTTNGTVKSNGACVMGRGIALEAKQKLPGIDKYLGNSIVTKGNISVHLGSIKDNTQLFSFVVKHNYYEEADIELIKLSCLQLMAWINKLDLKAVLLPRPGCGNGKLKWVDVQPIIEPLLDDRVVIVSFK